MRGEILDCDMKCWTLRNTGSRRADRTSVAPLLENASANDLPIPEEAPVIQTTLPSNDTWKLLKKIDVGTGTCDGTGGSLHDR